MSFFFAGLASAFAYKAFLYTHFPNRTNTRLMEAFDKRLYPSDEKRRSMAELHRQIMVKESLVCAVISVALANIFG